MARNRCFERQIFGGAVFLVAWCCDYGESNEAAYLNAPNSTTISSQADVEHKAHCKINDIEKSVSFINSKGNVLKKINLGPVPSKIKSKDIPRTHKILAYGCESGTHVAIIDLDMILTEDESSDVREVVRFYNASGDVVSSRTIHSIHENFGYVMSQNDEYFWFIGENGQTIQILDTLSNIKRVFQSPDSKTLFSTELGVSQNGRYGYATATNIVNRQEMIIFFDLATGMTQIFQGRGIAFINSNGHGEVLKNVRGYDQSGNINSADVIYTFQFK